jgi:hypothetical protein
MYVNAYIRAKIAHVFTYMIAIPAPSNPSPKHTLEDSSTQKQSNQIILMGAPEWVKGMIYRFHSIGIAGAGDWSKMVPTKKVGEATAILQRRGT